MHYQLLEPCRNILSSTSKTQHAKTIEWYLPLTKQLHKHNRLLDIAHWLPLYHCCVHRATGEIEMQQHTCTHTYTCTHMYVRAHAHTHTHTHTHSMQLAWHGILMSDSLPQLVQYPDTIHTNKVSMRPLHQISYANVTKQNRLSLFPVRTIMCTSMFILSCSELCVDKN